MPSPHMSKSNTLSRRLVSVNNSLTSPKSTPIQKKARNISSSPSPPPAIDLLPDYAALSPSKKTDQLRPQQLETQPQQQQPAAVTTVQDTVANTPNQLTHRPNNNVHNTNVNANHFLSPSPPMQPPSSSQKNYTADKWQHTHNKLTASAKRPFSSVNRSAKRNSNMAFLSPQMSHYFSASNIMEHQKSESAAVFMAAGSKWNIHDARAFFKAIRKQIHHNHHHHHHHQQQQQQQVPKVPLSSSKPMNSLIDWNLVLLDIKAAFSNSSNFNHQNNLKPDSIEKEKTILNSNQTQKSKGSQPVQSPETEKDTENSKRKQTATDSPKAYSHDQKLASENQHVSASSLSYHVHTIQELELVYFLHSSYLALPEASETGFAAVLFDRQRSINVTDSIITNAPATSTANVHLSIKKSRPAATPATLPPAILATSPAPAPNNLSIRKSLQKKWTTFSSPSSTHQSKQQKRRALFQTDDEPQEQPKNTGSIRKMKFSHSSNTISQSLLEKKQSLLSSLSSVDQNIASSLSLPNFISCSQTSSYSYLERFLNNFSKNPAAVLALKANLFTSYIDQPYFDHSAFKDALRDTMDIDPSLPLTKVEWSRVRATMCEIYASKPRRFSANFLLEERARLQHYRQNVQAYMNGLIPFQNWWEAYKFSPPQQLHIGMQVYALHPQSSMPQYASIIGFTQTSENDNMTYANDYSTMFSQVKFQNKDLGTAILPHSHIMIPLAQAEPSADHNQAAIDMDLGTKDAVDIDLRELAKVLFLLDEKEELLRRVRYVNDNASKETWNNRMRGPYVHDLRNLVYAINEVNLKLAPLIDNLRPSQTFDDPKSARHELEVPLNNNDNGKYSSLATIQNNEGLTPKKPNLANDNQHKKSKEEVNWSGKDHILVSSLENITSLATALVYGNMDYLERNQCNPKNIPWRQDKAIVSCVEQCIALLLRIRSANSVIMKSPSFAKTITNFVDALDSTAGGANKDLVGQIRQIVANLVSQ